MNILFNIQKKLPTLSKSEKKLAEYILNSPDEVLHMSAQALATAAVSSPATIIRFCRSIGLSGFTELKLRLSADLANQESEVYTEIVKGESIPQIKKKFLIKTTAACEETNNLLEDEKVEKAIKLIDQSEILYTYGIGASGLVAEDLFQKFTRLGKNVFLTKDHHLLASAMANGNKKAVMVLISNKGETIENLKFAKLAHDFGITVIAITQFQESSLAQLADLVLQTSSIGEAPIRTAATSSLLVQLYTIDILYYAYATKRYEQTISQIEQSRAAVKYLNFWKS